MENEKPSWLKYARHNYQNLYEWLVEKEPEIAAWWDGFYFTIQLKLEWLPPQAEDVLLLLRNRDGSTRSVAYNLVEVEIAHENSADTSGI